MANPATGCRCGSGAHPRRCELHPGNYETHVAELQSDVKEEEGATMAKKHSWIWRWKCSKCGHMEGNINTVRVCYGCGKKISCREAGGHWYPPGSQACDGLEDDGVTPCKRGRNE
jgi:hypothetical protein